MEKTAPNYKYNPTKRIFGFTSFFGEYELPDKTYIVILLIAFSQGVVGLSDLALSYLYKDDLKLMPADVSRINSMIIIPWIIKPVYGLISDTIPIMGYRRKSYLFLFGFLSMFCWISMASYVKTTGQAIFFLMINQTSSAFCNVIGDALIVEMSRKQSHGDQEAAAKNVSMFFIVKSIGSLLTALASGILLEYIDKRIVFLITSIFPLLIIISSLLLDESKYASNSNINAENEVIIEKSVSSNKVYGTINSIKDNETITKSVPSFSEQLTLFWSFLKKEQIYKPVIFIFLFMIPPSYSDPLFYFYTNELQFSPTIMGRLKLIYGISSLSGIWLYNAYLKSVNFKKIMWGTTILSMFFNLLSICLVKRVNLYFGISDFWFCVAADSLATSLGEINMMPILVLACNICPKNIEGTIYAFLVSVVNCGVLFSNQSGATFANVLGITDSNFEHLVFLIVISNLSYLIPLPLLFLINEEAYTKFQEYDSSKDFGKIEEDEVEHINKQKLDE